jgi:hypothetical protein
LIYPEAKNFGTPFINKNISPDIGIIGKFLKTYPVGNNSISPPFCDIYSLFKEFSCTQIVF